MKKEWQKKTLADVCQIRPPKSEARERVAPDSLVSFAPMEDLGIDRKFLNPSQVKPLASVAGSYTYFADGDVLLAKITPCFENGKLGIAAGLNNGIGFGSSEFIVFRPCAGLDKEYLYYFLSRPDFRSEGAERMGGAVGQQRVPKEFIESCPIPLPPLPEQQRIVGILNEAFDGIATAKANAEKNLQNARALFQSHLQSVFTQRGDEWLDKTIGDVCTLKSGTTVSVALEKSVGDLPYLKVADMNFVGNEVEIVSSSRFLNAADIGKKAVFPSGTTIFPKRGGAILTNKKRLTAVPICADLNIMGAIPRKHLVPKFLYFFFINIDMSQIGSGSSIPQINNYDIEPLVISFPESEKQQAKIACKLEKLSTETQSLASIYQRKLAALDELKKSLLHQAFTGKL